MVNGRRLDSLPVVNYWASRPSLLAYGAIVLSLGAYVTVRHVLDRRTLLIYGALAILFGIRIALRPIVTQPTCLDSKTAVPTTAKKLKSDIEPGPKRAKRPVPKRIAGSKNKAENAGHAATGAGAPKIQVLLFYSSMTGITEAFAQKIHTRLSPSLDNRAGCKLTFLQPRIYDLSYVEYDDYFVSPPKDDFPPDTFLLYLFLIPSYNIDTPLVPFLTHMNDTHTDFRIDTAPLSSLLGYSVFGFGDREGWPTEEAGFCFQAKEVDRMMAKLTGRKRVFPLGMGDSKTDGEARLAEWWTGIETTLASIDETGNLGEGVSGSGDAIESDEEVEDTNTNEKRRVDDVEDLGGMARSTASPLPIDFTTSSSKPSTGVQAEPQPMVPLNSPTHKSLTKQGYSIIGTHSGVKLCRWTKSALRGRGSCYKYSFYGIASHRCMEATPSLSCSNKCVFCWRHGTNPVGTTWRWTVDPPDEIFEGIREAHYYKIKIMKGVPGVRADRYTEAMDIRHCALSLVGEPLFYPHINQLLARLHENRISTFLVCNAQHPSHLQALDTVTQLYVSIDAANPESLKKIDRPLHRDYWERFMSCLDILREKRDRQRTVFRLTLVKGFNVEEAAEYAALVVRGQPHFIEIKGVTFCGTTSAAGAGLTMENVPFWEEVLAFTDALSKALGKEGLRYGVAAEHAHSCCILLGHESFRDALSKRWRTWIDYDEFFRCLEMRKETGQQFGPLDYVGAETPEWAEEGKGGFDPRDVRVWRKGKNKKPLPEGMGDIMREIEA